MKINFLYIFFFLEINKQIKKGGYQTKMERKIQG